MNHMMHEALVLQLAAERGRELQSAAVQHRVIRGVPKPKKDRIALAIEKHQLNSERRLLGALHPRTNL